MGELWEGCLACRDKSCCNLDIAHPLFVTQEEMGRIAGLHPDKAEVFNRILPCPFLMPDGLCMIHRDKPVDCRLFPFDVIKVDGEFRWIIWKIDCLILQDEARFEEYLKDLEAKFIPRFGVHLEDYASFRIDELFSKYGYETLREVRTGELPETKVFRVDPRVRGGREDLGSPSAKERGADATGIPKLDLEKPRGG